MHRIRLIVLTAVAAVAISGGASAVPSPAAESAPGASAAPASAAPRCTDIRGSLGRVEGAAGTTYYTIRLTNASARTCLINKVDVGFVNRHKILVGWPAAQLDHPWNWHPKRVHPGQTVRATLAVSSYQNYPRMDCLPYTPWRLRVQAAADGSPSFVDLDARVCTTRHARASFGAYFG